MVVGFVLVGLALMLYSPGRSAAVGWRRVYAIEAAAFFSLIALAVLGGMSLDALNVDWMAGELAGRWLI